MINYNVNVESVKYVEKVDNVIRAYVYYSLPEWAAIDLPEKQHAMGFVECRILLHIIEDKGFKCQEIESIESTGTISGWYMEMDEDMKKQQDEAVAVHCLDYLFRYTMYRVIGHEYLLLLGESYSYDVHETSTVRLPREAFKL